MTPRPLTLTMYAFNKLTPPQEERLALLLEEMGDALQVIGKILRHGYDSHDPTGQVTDSNRQALERELGDVLLAITLMSRGQDINRVALTNRQREKMVSVQRWLHHQSQVLFHELPLSKTDRPAPSEPGSARTQGSEGPGGVRED